MTRLFKRFPFVMQRDSAHCGVACVEMLCKYFGNDVSYDIILEFCRANVNGMSFKQIRSTVEHLGFLTKSVRIPLNELRKVNSICILHWNKNHYVVLYKVKGNSFYIADPAKGRIKYEYDDFVKYWSIDSKSDSEGYAMFVEPTDKFYNYTKYDNKSNSFRISIYLKQYAKSISLIFFTLLITGIFLSLLPFLTQKIVDIGIKDKNMFFIMLVLLGQLALTLGKITFDFVRKWILVKISMSINISMVSEFLIKLVRLPMWYIESKHIGDLQQRLYDHSRINSFLTTQIPNIIYSSILFLIFSIVLLLYNSIVYFVFAVFSILYVLWTIVFLKKRKVIDYEYFDKQSENNIKIYQYINNLQEIKLQNCEARRCAEWKETQRQMFSVQTKNLKLQQTQEIGSILLNETKNIVMTAFTAYAVILGNVSLGGMLAIQYIIGQLNGPVEQLMGFIYSSQDVRISMERINEVRNLPSEENIYGNIESVNPSFATAITVSHLNFSYDKFSDRYILQDINLDIKRGKVTAIVGASGSGKTTLLKILLGYYMPTEGTVRLGSDELKAYNIQWWRRQCGAVMQDGVIFSDTIARNISIEDDNIDYSRLNMAIRMSNSSEFIDNMPLGYNTVVGQEGIKLSKGQAQRILIARAIYKNPDYLFFDEATNSLDAKSENAIVSSLSDFFKDKTVVVIAHRLSTIINADQIAVLNDGRIVESGRHEQLLKLKGYYYDLVKKQLDV